MDASYDSLVVAKRITHHLLDERGNPINFNFGYWHKISQDLPHIYEITWSAFIMKREMLEQAYYQIGRKPYLYQANFHLVDINDMDEFEAASILYEAHVSKGRFLDAT